MTTKTIIRCPRGGSTKKLGLFGCGSTNVTGPDEEGLYDCLNCGLWFAAAEGR